MAKSALAALCSTHIAFPATSKSITWLDTVRAKVYLPGGT